jgi:DDE family transposase
MILVLKQDQQCDHGAPHPPLMTIAFCRLLCQRFAARRSLSRSMEAGYLRTAACLLVRWGGCRRRVRRWLAADDEPAGERATRIEIARMMAAMADLFCASDRRPPAAIVLDIDDTLDRVHGHQQLSLFNAHYDERCFLPIHIYEAASGKPVAVILREGKTPGGVEVRTILKHVVARLRRH